MDLDELPQGGAMTVTPPPNMSCVLYTVQGWSGWFFFVTGLGWAGLALFLSDRAGLERAVPGWQLLIKTGLQGFSFA